MVLVMGVCGQCDLHVRSFGSLLEAWNARRSQESPGMSSTFATIVFSQIYNRPLCSIFASSSEPAFAGPCEDLPLVCEDASGWCKQENGKTDGRMVVQGRSLLLMRPSPVIVCYYDCVIVIWKTCVLLTCFMLHICLTSQKSCRAHSSAIGYNPDRLHWQPLC